jgi:hypothetical protein
LTDHAHLRPHDPARPERSVAGPRASSLDEPGRADTSAGLRLLELQQSIGNRALSEMLMVQRDAASDTLMAGGSASPAGTVPTGSALTEDQRDELRRLTGNRITRAFTAFVTAVEQNRAAIKAAASDSGGFAELLLEIVLGRLLPGISKGIANLAQELPAKASNASYRLALAAMNEERTTALLETAVKFGREAVAGGGDVDLEGEDEIDKFLNTLENQFNLGADAIDANLPNLSDEALGVTCAAYDPTVAGIPQFRAAVRSLVERYERQVKPIGTTEYHWMNESSNFNLYWVVSPTGTRRLALLENYDLDEWISPELQQIAIEKYASSPAGRLTQGKVPEIPASRVGRLSG